MHNVSGVRTLSSVGASAHARLWILSVSRLHSFESVSTYKTGNGCNSKWVVPSARLTSYPPSSPAPPPIHPLTSPSPGLFLVSSILLSSTIIWALKCVLSTGGSRIHPWVKLEVFLQREILFYFHHSFAQHQLLINAVNLRGESIQISL